MPVMHLQLVISHAVWPEPDEAHEVARNLEPASFARLCGRGKRRAFARCSTRDWLAQSFGLPEFCAAPLTLMASAHNTREGYFLRADPVHFRLGTQGASVADPRGLNVTADEAAALVATLNRHFSCDGMDFVVAEPGKWLLHVPEKTQVTFAPLESLMGPHDIAELLPQGPGCGLWHRFLGEVQMLLHAHPVNERRAAQGMPLINSLWLWGAGAYPLSYSLQKPAESVLVDEPLIAALARAAGCRVAAVPEVPGIPEDERVLVVLDALSLPALERNPAGWCEAWGLLERLWFSPVRKWLSAGKISKLDLILPEAGVRVLLGRRDLFCLWRRAWRPWLA